MTQTYKLPLTQAQFQAIHRAARREQAVAVAAVFRALGRKVRGLFATRPARGGVCPRPAAFTG